MTSFRTIAIATALSAPSIVASDCVPPETISRAIETVDLQYIEEGRIESSVAFGAAADVMVIRLSRQPYEITFVSQGTDLESGGVLMGAVFADPSIADPAATEMELSYFTFRYAQGTVEITCADPSILSDELLREELQELIARLETR